MSRVLTFQMALRIAVRCLAHVGTAKLFTILDEYELPSTGNDILLFSLLASDVFEWIGESFSKEIQRILSYSLFVHSVMKLTLTLPQEATNPDASITSSPSPTFTQLSSQWTSSS